MVAAELEGVAARDQAETLVDEALQLDRADLGAVLLELRAALRLLVGVEIALDAVDLAVEQVDEGPEQVVEIVLEPRVGQHRGEAVDDRAELGADGIRLGQRTRIGFVPAGPMAGERQRSDEHTSELQSLMR